MSEEMLRNIELLREKANISYEEAANLLEQNGGDVVRVLMVLEQQGRLYQQAQATQQSQESQQTEEGSGPQRACEPCQGQEEFHFDSRKMKEKAKSVWDEACKHRLVVEKKDTEGTKETVINVSAPVAAGAALVAPWLAAASAVGAIVTGCSIKVKKDEK